MTQCTGTNRKGNRCGNTAIQGSDLCQKCLLKNQKSEDKRSIEERKTIWRYLKYPMTFASGLATMFAILSYFHPNIQVMPLEALDNSIMSTQFMVSNNGYIRLSDLEYALAIKKVVGRITIEPASKEFGVEKGARMRFPYLKDKPKKTILPNQSDTIDFNFKTLHEIEPIKMVDIGVIVYYKIWYLPFQGKKLYHFITKSDSNGKLHWFPVS